MSRFHTINILISLVVLIFRHEMCHGYVCIRIQDTRCAKNLLISKMMAEPPPATYSQQLVMSTGEKPDPRRMKAYRISKWSRMSSIARNLWRRLPSLRRNSESSPPTVLQDGILVDKDEIVVSPPPPDGELVQYRRQSRAAEHGESGIEIVLIRFG